MQYWVWWGKKSEWSFQRWMCMSSDLKSQRTMLPCEVKQKHGEEWRRLNDCTCFSATYGSLWPPKCMLTTPVYFNQEHTSHNWETSPPAPDLWIIHPKWHPRTTVGKKGGRHGYVWLYNLGWKILEEEKERELERRIFFVCFPSRANFTDVYVFHFQHGAC